MYWPQSFAGIVPPATPGMGTRDFAWPSHTAVVRCGVKPTNHASVKLSVVPVLPATGQPPCCAAVPVPRWTFCLRMSIAFVVTASEKTLVRLGLPRSFTLPSGNTTFLIAIGLTRQPPLLIDE